MAASSRSARAVRVPIPARPVTAAAAPSRPTDANVLLGRLNPEALLALTHHEWPGNVRELANVLERAQILAENQTITLDDLPASFSDGHVPVVEAHPLHLREVEKRHVLEVLRLEKGNKVHTAKALGISRRALYRLLSRYHITSEQIAD